MRAADGLGTADRLAHVAFEVDVALDVRLGEREHRRPCERGRHAGGFHAQRDAGVIGEIHLAPIPQHQAQWGVHALLELRQGAFDGTTPEHTRSLLRRERGARG